MGIGVRFDFTTNSPMGRKDYGMAIQQDIKDAIAKNLPAAVGEELQERLKQADQFERENKSLTKQIEAANNLVSELNRQLAAHRKLDEREASLAERIVEVTTREIQLRATLAETLEQAANDKTHAIFALAEIALGKRRYSETVERSGSRDNPTGDQYGNYRNLHESETVTKTVEQVG